MNFAVTVFGSVPTARMVRRAMAREGDAIFVSGTIGDAALGLDVRRRGHAASDHEAQVLARYLRPQPRLGLRALLRSYATAAMDVSDGLVKDLERLCRASDVGADIDVAAVPMSAAALALTADDPSRRRTLLTHGDDYEILFTTAAEAVPDVIAAATSAGVPVIRIGTVKASPSVRWLDDGQAVVWARSGYDHIA
jgi:thiamine-monophosphate kinase